MGRKDKSAATRFLALLLALAIVSPSVAGAQPRANEQQARARFKQGVVYYAAGAYDRALEEYEAAYQALPLPELMFNIGQAHRMKGERRQALDAYQRFTEQKPDGPAADLARRYIASLTHELDEEARGREAVRALPRDPDDDPKRARTEQLTIAAPPARRPTYKKWWPWTILGLGVAGVAVGVGLGVGLSHRGFSPTLRPELAESALVRF